MIMASKVGLKDAEYSALASGVKRCHDDSLSQIETAIQKLRSLNSKGGGLYAKALTPKVDAVVKQLNSIKKSMESVYTAHEEIIKSFQTAIDNYDIDC